MDEVVEGERGVVLAHVSRLVGVVGDGETPITEGRNQKAKQPAQSQITPTRTRGQGHVIIVSFR